MRPEWRGETVATHVRRVARALREAGVETPAVDARRLVAAAAGVSREALVSEPDRALSEAEAAALSGFLERRLRAEPVSRILGVRDFYGRAFEVTPATLDPRPETETLIEAVLEHLARRGSRDGSGIRILDVGTGSGALIATLLAELPKATGIGTDISADALAVAVRNAQRLGVSERLEVRLGRGLDGLTETFDILVSNPPYIPTGEIAALAAEVRGFDPRIALDGGADGLDVYRDLASSLTAVLPWGFAAFEIGAGQAAAVARLLEAAIAPGRIASLDVLRDLAGMDRCVAVAIHPDE